MIFQVNLHIVSKFKYLSLHHNIVFLYNVIWHMDINTR